MRLYKLIFTGIIVTLIALGYVYQRVEIVKLGYGVQESRKQLSSLVDQNSRLMYNLSKLESPRYLLASLDSEEVKFASHGTRQVNSYQLAHVDLKNSGAGENFVGRIFDFFTVIAEARPREL